jgi:hypothetical protein
MPENNSEFKIGDWIVCIIVFLPAIALFLITSIVILALIMGLIKLFTFWF